MTTLALLALLFVGAATALAIRGLMLPRAKASARLEDIGSYGFPISREQRPPEGAPSRSVLLAGAAYIGSALMKPLGAGYESEVKHRLTQAGLYDTAPKTVVGAQAASGVLLGSLMAVSNLAPSLPGRVAVGALGLTIGFALPYGWLRFRGRTRLESIDRKVPDLIDMLVVTLEGGLGFGASMQAASTRISGPLGDELRLTMQEQRMGLSMHEALLSLLDRVHTPSIHSFVRAVTQGEALGVSIGAVMRSLAAEMRLKRRQQAEERAQKAPVKMLFPLIFLMFPALGIVILGPAVFEIGKVLGGM